jgi:hypothetical protein
MSEYNAFPEELYPALASNEIVSDSKLRTSERRCKWAIGPFGITNTVPLHIKATYQLLEDKGVVTETGTFEEFRVSDKKYKLIYSSPSFNQTDCNPFVFAAKASSAAGSVDISILARA